MNQSTAAKKIQRAWRRTKRRVGYLGASANQGRVNYKRMKNVSYTQLAELLRRTMPSRYNFNYNSHGRRDPKGYLINQYNGTRMTRQGIVEMLGLLTNYRPNYESAARTFQRMWRGQLGRRRATFFATPFAKGLPKTALILI